MKKLKKIEFGNFCENFVVYSISNYLNSTLKFIRIHSDKIEDYSLIELFTHSNSLSIIDFSYSSRINGHCFDYLNHNSIKEIKVSFDEYKLKCLQSNFPNTLIINKTK